MFDDQDTSRFFFSAVQSPLASKLTADAAIHDLSSLHEALPTLDLQMSQQTRPLASWASDFMQQSLPMTLTLQAAPANSSEANTATRSVPIVVPGMLKFSDPGQTVYPGL